MIRNQYNHILPPMPKGKDGHTQNLTNAHERHAHPNEQLFPKQVVIQLP